ncbi:MAG: hypothetical protein C0403_16495, partial [Desulfobacterium sp.]|nr:hypothetical protein [Desulfobacterium sp.]
THGGDMKKIVLLSQGKHKDHLLVEMLSLFFPECEIHFSEPPDEMPGLSFNKTRSNQCIMIEEGENNGYHSNHGR